MTGARGSVSQLGAFLQKAEELSRMGRDQAAAEAAMQALALDADNVAALNLLAFSQARQNDVQSALATSRRALGLAPDDPWSHSTHCSVLWAKGDLDAAVESIDRAIAILPEHADFHALKAELLGAAGRPKAGLEPVQVALRLEPESVEYRLVRIDLLQELGRDTAADEVVAEVLRLDPGARGVHRRAGSAALRAGDAERAMELFQSALGMDHADAQAREGLVDALRAQNRLYRPFLALRLWVARQVRSGSPWLVFAVTMIALAGLGLFEDSFHRALVMAALLVPTALSDVLLLAHPIGRHALYGYQKVIAAAIAAYVIVGVSAAVTMALGAEPIPRARSVAVAATTMTVILAIGGIVVGVGGEDDRRKVRGAWITVGISIVMFSIWKGVFR